MSAAAAAAPNGFAAHEPAATAAVSAPLSADAADVAHPLHLLRIVHAPDGAAAAQAEGGQADAATLLPWLNAPAVPAQCEESGALAAPTAAPSQQTQAQAQTQTQTQPPLPALLVTHLAAVRRLQSQVPLFKHQLRALLDCWMARPDPRDAAAAAAAGHDGQGAPGAAEAAATAAAAAASRHADETALRVRALKEVYASLVNGLTHESHRIALRSDHHHHSASSASYQARQLFNSLDGTVYSPSMETQDLSLQHPSRMVNYDYAGKRESALAATTPWIQGRPPALMTDQQRQKQQKRRGADAAAAAGSEEAVQRAEDERLYRARTGSATASSPSSVAASPSLASSSSDLSALLSSSVDSFNLHSALLLNLVQCSGLNPFEQMQQRIRSHYVLPSSPPASADAPAAPATGTAATPAAAATPSVPAPLAADAHVSLLDSLLLHFLRVQHARNQETCAHLAVAYHAQQQAAIHSSNAAAAAAAAAAASSSGGAGATTPAAAAAAAVAAARELPPPSNPALPFVRKVFAPSALASPYAPRPAPPLPSAASHAGAGRQPNPVLGLVFSLPHTLHAYIEFEQEEEEEEGEEEEAKLAEGDLAAASATVAASSASASAARGLCVSRVAVVHWSELSTLVDGHTSSAFGLHRAVSAQAQLALWYFKQLVDRQAHREADKLRPHTTAPAAAAAAAAVAPAAPAAAPNATSASAAAASAASADLLLRHKPLRVLHFLLLWLCSYWDLQSRACAECKLHLSLVAPHALSLAHAGAAASAASSSSSDRPADPSLLPVAPLSHSPLVPLPPVVRMVGTEMRDYVPLHRACVEPYTLAHARS